MKHDPILQSGIHASLKAMHKMLVAATNDASEACGHIAMGEQNMAIGTILTLDHLLEQAAILYQAVIAMHRCEL